MDKSHIIASSHPLSRFRFCPCCGSEHFDTYDARAKRCKVCGFTYYHNAAAATVAVIVNEKQELLVSRRALEPARGTLDLPGGFVDPGESATEGVEREVLEETGRHAVVDRFLFSLPNTYLYSGFLVDTADLFFECHFTDDAPLKAQDDVAALRFVPLRDIRSEDFGLASVRRGVERLVELYNKEI